MEYQDLLFENLSILLKKRFIERGVNIHYESFGDSSSMSYRDVEYEFKFSEKEGVTMFTMRIRPEEKGLAEKVKEKLEESRVMSNKKVDKSRYFTRPRIFEEGDSLVVNCRIKRKIKKGKEEEKFREQLWAIMMKPAFERVYGYS